MSSEDLQHFSAWLDKATVAYVWFVAIALGLGTLALCICYISHLKNKESTHE